MKVMWCWRCRMDIPMVDEEEWALLLEAWHDGRSVVEEERARRGLPARALPQNFRET